MRVKITLTLLLIMLVLIPTVSIAWMSSGFGFGRDRGGFEDGLFWGADLNRNERLDRNEAKAVYNLANDEIFDRYDEDGNGLINRAEFMEFIQQSPWDVKFVHPKDKE